MPLALQNTLINSHSDYNLVIFCCGLMWSVLPIAINVPLRMRYREMTTFTKTIVL